MIVSDFGDVFADPSPLEGEILSPTFYRVRHLHIDTTSDPPLSFLTDVDLDEELAAWSAEVDPMFSDELLARWNRALELEGSLWPPDGQTVELADLLWATATADVKAFEASLMATPDLSEAQLGQALRVRGFDADVAISHPGVTPGLLAWLSVYPAREVRGNVAAHPLLPAACYEELWNDHDDVRVGLAENPCTPPDLLKRLAHAESVVVRSQVAFHPHLDELLLHVLAEDSFWAVRCNVAGNPAASVALIRMLANDDHPEVRDEAEQALSRRLGTQATAPSDPDISREQRGLD